MMIIFPMLILSVLSPFISHFRYLMQRMITSLKLDFVFGLFFLQMALSQGDEYQATFSAQAMKGHGFLEQGP